MTPKVIDRLEEDEFFEGTYGRILVGRPRNKSVGFVLTIEYPHPPPAARGKKNARSRRIK